jgi:hypothetical protein
VPSPSALQIDAGRAAWERLWAGLLTQPPPPGPEPESESEPAGEPNVQPRQDDPARRTGLEERRAGQKEVTRPRTM